MFSTAAALGFLPRIGLVRRASDGPRLNAASVTSGFCLLRSVLILLAATNLASADGRYHQVQYAPRQVSELAYGVTFTLWIPEGSAPLRGIIVHQHGCGAGACAGGETAAYDLHWQALARAHHCALMGPSYQQPDASDCRLWCDPRHGSGTAFLRALDDLAAAAKRPELAKVPWCLWGHSGGAFWASILQAQYPERTVAVWCRSGTAFPYWKAGEIEPVELSPAAFRTPIVCNPGIKERDDERFRKAWTGGWEMFAAYRASGAPIAFAPDPRTNHECGDSRYLAIPWFDACLATRLPLPGADRPELRPAPAGWLGTLAADQITIEQLQPAAEFTSDQLTACWLPTEAVAKAWQEYLATGAVSDDSPPAPPFVLAGVRRPDGSVRLTWDVQADFESGIRLFEVTRGEQLLTQVPKQPVGHFGRPLFQTMSYHDTPEAPTPALEFVDVLASPNQAVTYAIRVVNSVGLKSDPATVTVEPANSP